MKRITEKNNFIYLLFALLFFLLFGTIVEQFQFTFANHLLQASTAVMIAIAVLSFRSTKYRYWTGLGQFFAVVITVILSLSLEYSGLDYVHLSLIIVFLIWTTWHAVRQVLFAGAIDSNKVIGSICIYLLLGLIWALMYSLIAEALPAAFNDLEQAAWYVNFPTLSYYSFVTLTTLGYGDITPAMPITQFLAYMEALFGVFYLAILVASLIGARVSGYKL